MLFPGRKFSPFVGDRRTEEQTLELEHCSLWLSASYGDIEDLGTWLSAYGEELSPFALWLAAAAYEMHNMSVWLSAASSTVLEAFGMYLSATDGLTLTSMAMRLSAIKRAPSFQTTVAQRLSSIMSEV